MDTQSLITTVVALCSIGGWYVVLAKYIELRTILRERDRSQSKKTEAVANMSKDHTHYDDVEYQPGVHIPGMGPAPLIDVPDYIPEDHFYRRDKSAEIQPPVNSQPSNKRRICNWASIMHLSGFSIVTGFPLINIVVPAILWLLKKEQHPYLEKQGREVINFQISLTLIQLSCLIAGAFFMWLFPEAARSLLEGTKIIRVIFSSSMYFPVNLFTVIPFVWACIMMVRGCRATYNGAAFSYPLTQQFITKKLTNRTTRPKEVIEEPMKVNFG